MTKSLRVPVVVLLTVLAVSLHGDDTPLLIELPFGVVPSDVGANGSVVVGSYTETGGFYWMPTTRDIFIGGVGATAVSRNGRTIAGTARDAQGRQQAGIWQRGAQWRLLGSITPNAVACDGLLSSTYDTSDSGSVVVGLAWDGCRIARAFRWEESTGIVDLGSTVPGRSSRANGVSGDGRIIIGWQDAVDGFRQGARWVNGTQEVFKGPTGFPVGEARAVNTDGSVIVGQVCRPDDLADQSAWVWTTRDGLQCVAMPARRLTRYIGVMLATSDDGRVIGGAHSFGLDSEAVLWIDRAPAYLKDYLRTHGVPTAFDGWLYTGFITGVSQDGSVLVGYGIGRRDIQGYIVILPKGSR